MLENIKLKLDYQSRNSNGWPLIMIKVNEVIVDRFEANSSTWEGTALLKPAQINTLKIEHYGKNYLTDSDPDKYFELSKIYINDVDLKHHIHKFKQIVYLPPWDDVSPPQDSLYLGHNGTLILEFTSPIDKWIQNLFNMNSNTMDGQQTTREILAQIKEFFNV
jgi:hypothetical protein